MNATAVNAVAENGAVDTVTVRKRAALGSAISDAESGNVVTVRSAAAIWKAASKVRWRLRRARAGVVDFCYRS